MPGMNVVASSTLVAGIRGEFVPTYERMYAGMQKRLAPFAKFVPSNKATETFAFFESAPAWRIWRDGESISSKPFKDSGFTVRNRDWGVKVEWRENDKNDDQTGSLLQRAREAGSSGPLLHERVIFQMLTGATDHDLLPSVPTAADGASLFSGSARFGAASGNVVTGTGVASGAAIVTDFFGAKARFAQFQDTESQPLWDPSVFDGGFSVFFNADNEKVFVEAFRQNIQAYAVNTATSNAGVSNLPMSAGLNVNLVPTQRITGNDWYVGLTGCPDGRQPFVVLERQAPRESTQLMENSDIARATKIEAVQWDARYGYGIATPYALVKIDN